MVKELEEAVLKLERLDAEKQREIAKLLQEEMAWDNAFEKTQGELSKMADEALQEFRAGKTTQTDW